MNYWIVLDAADSELCHKFTQSLVDKKQVDVVGCYSYMLLFLISSERSDKHVKSYSQLFCVN